MHRSDENRAGETAAPEAAGALRTRWGGPGGYREVLRVGLPLIVSMSSVTLMQFTDRMFLSNYSVEAIAAATPAGVAHFLAACFFMGLIEYTNVIVARFDGMARPERVGSALWQGLWCCVPAGLVLVALIPLGDTLFRWAGHAPAIRPLEAEYFRILCGGTWLMLAQVAMSCFFSGRGLTKPVMIVNLVGTAANIPLDYALINGLWGMPELGIGGAAIATVFAWGLETVLFALIIFTRHHEWRYRVRSAWRPDPRLLGRLVRFGGPSGAQFFIDMFAISVFIVLIGRIGLTEQAASNMVFAINTLAYLPVVGLSIAASILVGNAAAQGDPARGDRAASSAMHIGVLWMVAMAALFVGIPGTLLDLFRPRAMPVAEFAELVRIGTTLLRFVALYSLFDAVAITYFGALRGGGDTRYVMLVMGAASVCCIVVPVFLAVQIFHSGLLVPFLCLTVYIVLLAGLFRRRFRRGCWKSISVVEDLEGSDGAAPRS